MGPQSGHRPCDILQGDQLVFEFHQVAESRHSCKLDISPLTKERDATPQMTNTFLVLLKVPCFTYVEAWREGENEISTVFLGKSKNPSAIYFTRGVF